MSWQFHIYKCMVPAAKCSDKWSVANASTFPRLIVALNTKLHTKNIVYNTTCVKCRPLASCLINAKPLPAHRPATDENSLIGCTAIT